MNPNAARINLKGNIRELNSEPVNESPNCSAIINYFQHALQPLIDTNILVEDESDMDRVNQQAEYTTKICHASYRLNLNLKKEFNPDLATS